VRHAARQGPYTQSAPKSHGAPIHERPHYANHSFYASGSQEEIALGRRRDDHPWIERLRFVNPGGALADVGILEVIRRPLVSAELSGALARCLSVPDFASHHLRSATANSDVASS
jgi:hypothetical protein